jgi:biotin transport system substrate-specific component
VNPNAATLRLAVLPRSGLLADALLIVLGAGLVAACAQISFSLPFTPVPITGQTFAVVLVGASLGVIRGAASLTLYLLAGIAGLHVYADGGHGWTQVTGATGGYLLGFVLAAALTGWLAEQRHWDRRFSSSIAAMLTGNVVIYLFGVPWLAAVLGSGGSWLSLEDALEFGLYPFVPGDIFKLYLAAAVLPAAWKVVEHVSPKDDDAT